MVLNTVQKSIIKFNVAFHDIYLNSLNQMIIVLLLCQRI